MDNRFYLTTAIPYVNGAPHVGHALELVQADVLARHARRRGRPTRFLTGTDDNAPKNVQSAHAAGQEIASFVDENAQRFAGLREPLGLSNDDFIRTSSDPRHRPTVEWLWRACEAAGDLYRRRYDGWYCTGCEQFYEPGELRGGRCPEHRTAAEHVSETNWFFRLSRYEHDLREAVRGGDLRVEPEHRRNEVLAFVERGLHDFSVSRPRERAHGWGIAVPGDAAQVVYVWFDALANYVSALHAPGGDDYRDWWLGAADRVHVIGKGILRFHTLYWPAILASAGQPWPTTVYVHDYLTVDGTKIGKSLGNALDPADLAARYGTDALRWWLLREVPRSGDADFTVERLVSAANRDLANGIGNFVQRTRGLLARTGALATGAPVPDIAAPLLDAIAAAPATIDRALDAFDFRRALDALAAVVSEGNRYVELTRPWETTSGRPPGCEPDLRPLVTAVDVLGDELAPFVPGVAARIRAGGPGAVFERLAVRSAGAEVA
jgi:methionyl-tRNA synthetase